MKEALDALTLLDNAVAVLQVDRNTHAKLQQASIIIRKALESKKKELEPKKEIEPKV